MARRPISKPASSIAVVPVLPVRDAVHFPGLINTVMIIRERSQRAIRAAMEAKRAIIVVAQRDHSLEDPEATDLFTLGTFSEILQSVPMPDGSLRVVLRGLRRIEGVGIELRDGTFYAAWNDVNETPAEGLEVDALMRGAVERFVRVVELNKEIPAEALHGLQHVEDPGLLADTIAHHLPLKAAKKQTLLSELNHRTRLEQLVEALIREEEVLEVNAQIQARVRLEIGDSQREFYLREQLRTIQKELRESFSGSSDSDELEARAKTLNLPEPVMDRVQAEIRRLDRLASGSQEAAHSREYVEVLLSVPWTQRTQDRIDLDEARRLLDAGHYGLDAVKERILDFLAVRKLRGGTARGSILCLTGPPGVGKTSLAKAIAQAMGRQFARVALGGVRDAAEIRGHRRAYVGAAPGRIVQALRDTGVTNPLILLDEIDKLTTQGASDPADALLETLDREQNDRFVDHFLEAPIDLSGIVFVATANTVDFIPAPLLDRMEIIQIPGYTEAERVQIARDHILPIKIAENGLTHDQISLETGLLEQIVSNFVRESGVRGLARHLDALCRSCARKVADGVSTPIHVELTQLESILGRKTPPMDILLHKAEVGVAKGLVVSQAGGDMIEIEVSALGRVGAEPVLRLTGNMGKVMMESAEAAWSCVRATLPTVAPDASADRDIHIHVPDAAIPKDGPSAGITIAVAIVSALTGRAVRPHVAMTGEISLRGRVLGVGGIREKVLAAQRYGMEQVFIPIANAGDVASIPKECLDRLEVIPVESFEAVLRIALES